MDSKQKQRAANRGFYTGEEGQETEYTIYVSGDDAEIHRREEKPWENAEGTGPDVSYDIRQMSTADLKKLIECANWALEKSAAFEAKKAEVTLIMVWSSGSLRGLTFFMR